MKEESVFLNAGLHYLNYKDTLDSDESSLTIAEQGP